jgi:hypothetical protein
MIGRVSIARAERKNVSRRVIEPLCKSSQPGKAAPRREILVLIVEFSQSELQKTEADIADTDAKYQYRLTQIVLAYTISVPK